MTKNQKTVVIIGAVTLVGVLFLNRGKIMAQVKPVPSKPVPSKPVPSKPKKVVYPLIQPNRIVIRYLGVFGNRNNPYRRGYGYHSGVDYYGLSADNGFNNPVVAIADGVVVQSSPTLSARGYGEIVVIHHPELKIWSRYAHLNTRAKIKIGAKVTAGQQIGTIGTSGTDNTHLHFDILKKAALSSSWRWIPDNGFSKEQVLDIFHDPLVWLKNNNAFDLGDL
jgi:murein DD-endopeptidase MepM/ murein hydrolase activator NlpD